MNRDSDFRRAGAAPLAGQPASGRLRIGDWTADPAAGALSRGGDVVRLEERTMRLLLELARRPGEAVSIDDLLLLVWPDVIVTPDSVYQAVASLRRVLGDDARRPRYVATVPRLGYRLVAAVGPDVPAASAVSPPSRRWRWRLIAGLAGGAAIIALAGLAYEQAMHAPRAASQPALAIGRVGVAPFVDLTPSMDQDALADEMSEGLADRLSADPSLRSPGFRSTYYLIGKPVTLAEAAKALGVDYVVDGGVRRTGAMVRISARLVRAADGRVLWTGAYDRPIKAMPSAQAAIAGEVARRLAGGAAQGPGR